VKGPIVIFLGGEDGGVGDFLYENNLWTIFTKELDGLPVYLEHRFYGLSHPSSLSSYRAICESDRVVINKGCREILCSNPGEASNERRSLAEYYKFHTLQQAVEDVASFVIKFKSMHPALKVRVREAKSFAHSKATLSF